MADTDGYPVADTNSKNVRSGTYKIEPTHTRILFSLSHMGFATYYGEFVNPSGTLILDAAAPMNSRLSVKVPVGAVTTTSEILDQELRSADWLDAERFPYLTFDSTSVEAATASSASVTGNLSIHGVTKSIEFHVNFNGAGINPLNQIYTAGFEISGNIRRSDFGVAKYVPLIGDEMKLIIAASFEIASASSK